MHPKKSLGQHWLHDEASLDAMVSAGDISANDVVLEVGPGLGTLTKKLVKRAKQVVAVELDDILVTQVHNRVPADNLVVQHQDILQYDFTTLPKDYKVIANIPYYLTSNLLRVLLESSNPPKTIVLLIQKEVAERIAASPGQMSILSVSVQLYAEAELKELVPAELFTPPPKVDSQIIQIKRRDQSLFDDLENELFFKVVRAGFSEKRKKLRSSLSGGLQISKSDVDKLLIKAEIASDARAQELTLEDWYRLTKHAIL
ncbi:ribosomal RNA small subunit methyltransferase A [Candidatus Saccharibacteria bacterium]|nr:ribosomal RNA small subunit methyltransferase A [Candidatus Saccharibacteria bacterium]